MDALGKIGDPSAVPLLINNLQYALDDLRKIGDSSPIPALINALQENDSDLSREMAAQFLKCDLSATTPDLITALEEHDWCERANVSGFLHDVVMSLKKIGDFSAIPYLINALEDDNSRVRKEAASALGEIGNPSTIPSLINAFADRAEDEDVRWSAGYALGQIGNSSAVPNLAAILNDVNDNLSVRIIAAQSLGNIGSTSAIPYLINALEDDDDDMRAIAFTALVKMDIAALISAFQDNAASDTMREIMVCALERISNTPSFIIALNHTDLRLREIAAHTLEKMNDDLNSVSVDDLITDLQDDDPWVQDEAARTLEKIGNASTVPALINALNKNNLSFPTIASALEKIGDLRAIPPLIKALKDDSDTGWRTISKFNEERTKSMIAKEIIGKFIEKRGRPIAIIIFNALRGDLTRENINANEISVLWQCLPYIDYFEYWQIFNPKTLGWIRKFLQHNYFKNMFLPTLRKPSQGYVFPVNVYTLRGEIKTDEIGKEFAIQIFGKLASNGAISVRDLKLLLLKRLGILKQEIVIIIYEENPSPETLKLGNFSTAILDFCSQLIDTNNKIRICWLTQKILEPPLKSFNPYDINLKANLEKWMFRTSTSKLWNFLNQPIF